jgi:hypothetical protein
MKLTVAGKDVISISEDNVEKYKQEAAKGTKFHVIKFNFEEPTKEKVEDVLKYFDNTNRFIIADNIKFYNGHLKYVGKKYYVQNTSGNNFISFVRKNNKILADLTTMTNAESRFILENYLEDLLRNCEIIIIDENDMAAYSSLLKSWPGNVIVRDPNYKI